MSLRTARDHVRVARGLEKLPVVRACFAAANSAPDPDAVPERSVAETSTRRLHAHHIVHWTDFGPTDVDNLVLLCSFHHHLVHEGGWTLTGTATDHRITRPDGTPVPAAAVNGHDVSWKPPDLETMTVADPCGLYAQAGAGERYDHNDVVDVAWTVNDHHRKRFRGTVTVAN